MSRPNYNIDPHVNPHYFDLESGVLFQNENKLASALDRGRVHIDTVWALGDLLLDDFEIDTERYERVDASDWSLKLYRRYGTWLDHAVTPPEQARTNLSRDVFDRAYYLGLGAHHKSIVHPNRFGSLAEFYDQLELVAYRQPGWYDHWPRDWFADYVQECFETKEPGETLTEAIIRRGEAVEGPTRDIIISRAGLPMDLLEERGYANIRAWDRDTHIDWNIAFRMANDRKPGKKDFAYLGSRERLRGPSLRGVIGTFKKLRSYQEAADERYPLVEQATAQRVSERAAFLRENRKGRTLVLPTLYNERQPLWMRARVSAQYLLLDAIQPSHSAEPQKERYATFVRQKDFLRSLEQFLGRIDEISQVRNFAYELDPAIEADIWPKHNPEHLIVPR